MIAEAIIDTSQTGEILIGCCDSFGTTLVAAEKTGRVARIVEMDPQQCDLIVRRFMAYTSGTARIAATGRDYESVALERVEQETEFSAAANKSE
jgi:DNA modification methylase